MPKIQSFRDLVAWQEAMDLADDIYEFTDRFPARERFGLGFQMRKAAVSTPSNIAEGHFRRTNGYLYHLEIALGSNGELDTQCEIAARRRFIAESDHKRLASRIHSVGRLTRRLMQSVAASQPRP